MRVAVGADERTHLADAIVAYLHEFGHDVTLIGPLAGPREASDWPLVSQAVA